MRAHQRKVSGVQEGKPSTGLHELSLLAKLIKPENGSKASNFKMDSHFHLLLPDANLGHICWNDLYRHAPISTLEELQRYLVYQVSSSAGVPRSTSL